MHVFAMCIVVSNKALLLSTTNRHTRFVKLLDDHEHNFVSPVFMFK